MAVLQEAFFELNELVRKASGQRLSLHADEILQELSEKVQKPPIRDLVTTDELIANLVLKLAARLNSTDSGSSSLLLVNFGSRKSLLTADSDITRPESSDFELKCQIVSIISSIKSNKNGMSNERSREILERLCVLLDIFNGTVTKRAETDDFWSRRDLVLRFFALLKNYLKANIQLKLEASESAKSDLFRKKLETFLANFADHELLVIISRIIETRFTNSVESCMDSTSLLYILNKYIRLLDVYVSATEKSKMDDLKVESVEFMFKTLEKLLASRLFEATENHVSQRIRMNSAFNEATLYNEFQAKLVALVIKLMLATESAHDGPRLAETKQKLSSICFEKFSQQEFSRLDLVFISQDDLMIDFNLDCLKRELQSIQAGQIKEDSIVQLRDLSSHCLFMKLLISISFDYQVMIDWLISNETNFLLYLVKYLKLLLSHLNQASACNKSSTIDFSDLNDYYFHEFATFLAQVNALNETTSVQTSSSVGIENKYYLNKAFGCLSELTNKVKALKRLFPYNCEPLLKLLKNVMSSQA